MSLEDIRMANEIAQFGWTGDSLGPPQAWPASLRTTIRIMLTSRYAMWMGWGPDLTFLYNDAYAPTLGSKHPRALGRPASEVWGEIWPVIGPRIEQVIRQGVATWDNELRLLLERAGFPEETYHTFSYSPLFDDDGHVAGMLCVVMEETERVIGDRRLRLLRELAAGLVEVRAESDVVRVALNVLRSAGEDLPFALIYLCDEAGEQIFAGAAGMAEGHEAAPTLLTEDHPWSLDLAEGSPLLVAGLQERLSEVLPTGAWDRPPRDAALVRLSAQGQGKPVGRLVAGLNPHRIYDEAYAGFLTLLAGQISAALASARAYEAETRRAEALAEIDRAKTAFFSNISHEFRTPLTLMIGPLEQALQEPADRDVDQRELLSFAHRNAMRMQRMVNALLDFARIEAGRVTLHPEPIDLSVVTADLAANFSSACERAGLRLSVDCPPLSCPVTLDPGMWEKIVLNLLSNAFKFTLHGGIRIGLREAGDQVVLEVVDTGVGIPSADLPRIFERFHRVEGQRGRTHEGTGIGLALVRELIELHEGTIAVDSQIDVGSRFTVTLPLGIAAADATDAAPLSGHASAMAPAFVEEALRWLPDAAVFQSHDRLETMEPEAAPPDAILGLRILVVDDNADMRAYLQRLLSRFWLVETAVDGSAALVAARRNRPDVIVSDVMMPQLDGFGLLRALREDVALNTVPVILLSARAGEEAQVEGLESGANDYLVKPFSARELVARVKACLAMARVRRDADTEIAIRAAEFEAALSAVPNPVWFTRDLSLGIWANEQANDLRDVWSDARGEPAGPLGADGVPHVPLALLERVVRGETVRNEEITATLEDGSRRVMMASASLLPPLEGRTAGAVCAALDITGRKHVETLLREQKRILEMVATGASLDVTLAAVIALMETSRPDTVCGIMILNEDGESLQRAHGENLPEAFLDALDGASIRNPYPGPCAEVADRGEAIILDDVSADRSYAPEWRALMAACGLHSSAAFPVKASDGRVIAVFGAYADKPLAMPSLDPSLFETAAHLASIALERAQVEASLVRAHERLLKDHAVVERLNHHLAGETDRLRTLFEQAPSFMCVLSGPSHRFDFVNAAYLTLVGSRSLIGLTIREAFPELEQQGFFEKLDHVFRSKTAFSAHNSPVTLQRVAGAAPELRYTSFTYQPILGPAGEATGIFVVGHDVTESQRAAEAQSLLIHELNHRVKNTLATVQSLASQSFRDISRPEVSLEAFDARLLALSRAHDVLTRANWTGAELGQVVAQALAPFRAVDQSRFEVSGLPILLSAREALILSMCLHELATNAVKYGALGAAAGTVSINWDVGGSGRMRLEWMERGGPPVEPPQRRGFGSKLIERGLARELDGEAVLSFAPDGLVCIVEAGLDSLGVDGGERRLQ